MPLAINTRYLLYGKVKNPRCFKNIWKLICRYQSQRKSWMDSTLFEEWVKDLNKKFQAKERKVQLIIDNCLEHPITDNMSHVKIVFLPLNTTFVSQLGITRRLITHYQKRLIKFIPDSFNSKKPLPQLALLTALQLFVSA